MCLSSADILIVCPGLTPYHRKTDNSIWSVRNIPIIGLTAVRAGRPIVESGHKADNVKSFVPEKTHSPHALLPTLGKVQGASVRGIHPDPGVVRYFYNFEHGMFWKTEHMPISKLLLLTDPNQF